MLTIGSGHSASYLTDAVAAGRENYYTGAVAAGEPPGRWWGRGAASLGLLDRSGGQVETQDMTALYERFIDPRDERFADPLRWDEAVQAGATLGHTGRRYKTEDEIYAALLAKEPGADAERRAALLVQAGKQARKNVAFMDATFNVQKSITVLHTAFEAQEVQARSAAERARSALAALTAPDAPAGAAAVHDRTGSAVQPVHGETGALAGPGGPGSRVEADPREVDRLTAELESAEARAESWATYRRAVEDAIWAGNQAALTYLSDKAGYARVGHHGGAAGRWIDAHDWTVASFFQHDSRDHDPHLHIHNAILNRVEGADGKWRTLDSKAIHKFRGAAAEVGDRVMEQHLSRSLGVRFAMRPDGKAREVVGIDQAVMDLFSSRRRSITAKTGQLVAAFEQQFGRSPNSLELDRLQRQAAFATRRAKSHDGETVEERLQRWDAQLRAEVRGGLAAVAGQVMKHSGSRPAHATGDADVGGAEASVAEGGGASAVEGRPARYRKREVIETALADLQDKQAAWTAPDLTRAISVALPDQLGNLTAEQTAQLLDSLTQQALQLAVPLDASRPADELVPDGLRRADGTSAYQAPGAARYATPAHIHTERLLKAAALDRTAPAVPRTAVDRLIAELAEGGIELGADQAAAVRGVLTSGASVETLVGPAGTGKSFVVGTIAKAWADPDTWTTGSGGNGPRRVVGLAASQIATEVLAGEGLAARNISQWLKVQDRIAGQSDESTARNADRAWGLDAGDLVVVDESAMANTADLARIHAHCTAAGAKLLLVGDHRQLAAVGAGGAMDLIANSATADSADAAALGGAVRHELTETRRFREPWEGPASLRLRDHDETVLAEYHKRGRLLDCGAMEQAEASAARAWLADTLNGRRSVLIVDTNEQAAQMSARLRAEMVRLGLVDDNRRVALGLQGTFAGAGDLVQPRRNGWDLAGYAGNPRGPINREQYRVLEVLDNGDMRVATDTTRAHRSAGPTGGLSAPGPAGSGSGLDGVELTLPAAYVAEHLALGYASTVHAAQGITVHTSHTVATGTTSVEALYVGLTRGELSNTAHVVTEAIPADAPIGETKHALHRSPQAVLAGAFEAADPQLSALAQATQSAADTDNVRTPAELFADAAQLATAGRTARWLDELVTDGRLSPAQRAELAAEDGANTLTTLLRRVELAGHDPRQVLTNAIDRRSLDDARQITNVLHRRITETTTLDPIGDSFASWIPNVDEPQWRAYLSALATAADERRSELGRHVAEAQPQWAVEALGPVPADDAERRTWLRRAAAAAAHRDLVGHDDTEDALGPAPKPGQAEVYASWRAAWRALGRPEADRAEAEMSDGQLRVRIRAYDRETTWAPPYVANELAGTRQAADKHRRTATVRRAEAAAPAPAAANANSSAGADSVDAGAARRAALHQEAEQAEALAAALDARAAELADADEVRAQWYAHTAETRAAADRARAELTARETTGNLDHAPEPALTAEEWLAVERQATLAEDPHRSVTADHEVTDIEAQREHDQRIAVRGDEYGEAELVTDSGADPGADQNLVNADADADADAEAVGRDEVAEGNAASADESQDNTGPAPAAEAALPGVSVEQISEAEQQQRGDRTPDHREASPAPPDIRRRAEHETAHTERADGTNSSAGQAEREDTVRVPSADETAASVHRAQRALAELRQREVMDERRANDEARDVELARWQHDSATTSASSAVSGAGDGVSADRRQNDRSQETAAVSDAANSSADASGADTGPVLERGSR